MSNIILIGMPGVGKSTVGVVLAKHLGYHFLDSDLVIQEREGKLLHEIISENGTAGFLKIEDRINASIETDRTVIATGGSAVYGEQAMEHFRKTGKIVYLSLPYRELEERLGDLTERGVALQPGQTLRELYEERKPLYEQYGEIRIDCSSKQIREIVAEIVQKIL
ncbi:MAG: shikimate kinase [Lachnospiraceae bacterium]